METKQAKIKAIYEKIANKDLTFWCKFWAKKEISWGHITFEKWFEFTLIKSRKDEKILYAGENFWWPLHFTNFGFEDLKNIWHPVMIWDVLDWIENNVNNWFKKCCECWSEMYYEEGYYCSNEECENDKEPEDLVFLSKWNLVIDNFGIDWEFVNNDIFLWNNLKLPIEDQSDECIDFVYSLLEKENKL